jgi:hypothetical protein
VRTCAQCKVEDHEILQAGGESTHFVVPEIKYLGRAEDFSPLRQGRKGWTPKVFQGRPGMVRMLCVNCLNENRVRDKVWNELRQDALKLEKTKSPDNDFYAVLCN